MSRGSVAATLQQDLLPLRAAVVRLLQVQGRGLQQQGLTGAALPGPGAAAGVAGEQVVLLEGWLSLQRLLDVLERVVEIAAGW